MPNKETQEALKTVAEDLEHLRDDWWENPSDPTLRRGSAILRRFLAEGILRQAWKSAGFEREPMVRAPRLESLLGHDLSSIEFAFAGGAHLQGTFVAGACVNKGNRPPVGGPDVATAMDYQFKLSAFTESLALVLRGQKVNRRELVKYFAHEKGGVHLDGLSSRRRKEEEQLVRSLAGFERAAKVFNKDAFYFELLSIGQAIGRAPDLQKLIAAIRAA